jgi:hypothetical protein
MSGRGSPRRGDDDRGDIEAPLRYAHCLANGIGVAMDLKEAARYSKPRLINASIFVSHDFREWQRCWTSSRGRWPLV